MAKCLKLLFLGKICLSLPDYLLLLLISNNTKIKLTMYKTIVRSTLEYASGVWSSHMQQHATVVRESSSLPPVVGSSSALFSPQGLL